LLRVHLIDSVQLIDAISAQNLRNLLTHIDVLQAALWLLIFLEQISVRARTAFEQIFTNRL